jgi:acyl-CoA thioester hydrolase
MSDAPVFRLERVAGPADIDELDHVSNLTYLRWVQEVAIAHSVSVGYGHPEYRALGAIFVVRRHEIDYLSQARAGDAIVLETWVDAWRGASSIRKTRIRRDDGTLLAQAETLWALMSLESGRPCRIPDELKQRFA